MSEYSCHDVGLCSVMLCGSLSCLFVIPGVSDLPHPLGILSSLFVPDYLSPVYQPCLCEFLFKGAVCKKFISNNHKRVLIYH